MGFWVYFDTDRSSSSSDGISCWSVIPMLLTIVLWIWKWGAIQSLIGSLFGVHWFFAFLMTVAGLFIVPYTVLFIAAAIIEEFS